MGDARERFARLAACCRCGEPYADTTAAHGDPIHHHAHAYSDAGTDGHIYCASTDSDCDGYRFALSVSDRVPFAEPDAPIWAV